MLAFCRNNGATRALRVPMFFNVSQVSSFGLFRAGLT
jgi:hypothetical protein